MDEKKPKFFGAKEAPTVRCGKKKFFIGVLDGERAYIKEPSWDCGWYWCFGYVKTYHAHQHFDGLFLHGDWPMNALESTPLSERERWELCELFKEAYILRSMADAIHLGGAHITEVPVMRGLWKGLDPIRDVINKVYLPAVFKSIEEVFMRTYTFDDLQEDYFVNAKSAAREYFTEHVVNLGTKDTEIIDDAIRLTDIKWCAAGVPFKES